MKKIMYIIALVSMAGAGFVTYKNVGVHQEELNKTTDLEKRNNDLKAQVKKLESDIVTQVEEKSKEQDKNNELASQIELEKRKVQNLVKQSNQLDQDIVDLKREQSKLEKVEEEAERLAADLEKDIDEIPAYFEEVESEKKKLNASHNALLAEVERFTGDLKARNSELAALKSEEQRRRDNLKANGVSSLITLVDNDWGIVSIKPHSDAQIKQDSQLIVVRGAKHIGRLYINAIEPERVLADIDYGSLVSGMRIRPGDRVILGKVVTR